MKLMNHNEWSEIWNNRLIRILDFPWRFIMWRNYLKLLKKVNLTSKFRVLEFGSGMGINSFKIKRKYKCSITLVDNCSSVLKESREFFRKNDTNADIVNHDILKFNNSKKYDIVFSEGVVEHFSGNDRINVFEKHINAAKKNGYIMMFFPRDSKLYWFIRKILNSFNLWYYSEHPFSEKEILEISKNNNIKVVDIIKPIYGLWIGFLAQKV